MFFKINILKNNLNNMKKDNKKALYESIMTSVAKEVKKALNESYDNSISKNIIEYIKKHKKTTAEILLYFNDGMSPEHLPIKVPLRYKGIIIDNLDFLLSIPNNYYKLKTPKNGNKDYLLQNKNEIAGILYYTVGNGTNDVFYYELVVEEINKIRENFSKFYKRNLHKTIDDDIEKMHQKIREKRLQELKTKKINNEKLQAYNEFFEKYKNTLDMLGVSKRTFPDNDKFYQQIIMSARCLYYKKLNNLKDLTTVNLSEITSISIDKLKDIIYVLMDKLTEGVNDILN